MTQRIDRRMYLRALASLGAIVSGPRSRLRRRLQRAAIDDHRRRLRLAPCELAQQRTHVPPQDLEDPGPYPALRLLIDRIHPGKRTVDAAAAARIGYLAWLAA